MERQFLYRFPYGIGWLLWMAWILWKKPVSITPSSLVLHGLFWTWEEYVFHRWVLHQSMYPMYHYLHHLKWTRLSTFFSPQWLIVPMIYVNYRLTSVLFGREFGENSLVFTPMYYMLFEWVHYRSHFSLASDSACIVAVKQYHRLHHVDETTNYGITSPLWDWIGDTLHPDMGVLSKRDVLLSAFPMLWFYSCSTSMQKE